MSCTWPCGDLELEMLAWRERLIKEVGGGRSSVLVDWQRKDVLVVSHHLSLGISNPGRGSLSRMSKVPPNAETS